MLYIEGYRTSIIEPGLEVKVNIRSVVLARKCSHLWRIHAQLQIKLVRTTDARTWLAAWPAFDSLRWRRTNKLINISSIGRGHSTVKKQSSGQKCWSL